MELKIIAMRRNSATTPTSEPHVDNSCPDESSANHAEVETPGEERPHPIVKCITGFFDKMEQHGHQYERKKSAAIKDTSKGVNTTGSKMPE